MNPNDPNVCLLERAAEQLGEALLAELVFVGGAVAGVLITDPAMPEIRPTKLEAFRGRGQGNFLFSHDLEDLMAVVDGRASLLDECRTLRAITGLAEP